MSTLTLLLIILFVLMAVIGRKRGIRAFFMLFINVLLLAFSVILIILKLPIFFVAVITSIILALINIVWVKPFDKVSRSAVIATSCTYIIILVVTMFLMNSAKLAGFPMEEGDEIATYSLNIGIDFTAVTTYMMMVSALGVVIDISISIATSMEQLYLDQPMMTRKDLFSSGMNISRDILGTTTNTLYFAYLGSYLTLIIWVMQLHYSLGDFINSQVFASEFFTMVIGGIAVICAIPITCFIMMRTLKMNIYE